MTETDDGIEKVDYNQYEWEINDEFNDRKVDIMMKKCLTMIRNGDGIPIIYMVLRVLYNIIRCPTNNKFRQVQIHQITMRTDPYGQVTIDILKQCGFQIIKNKQFLFLKPDKQSNEIKAITYYGDIMVFLISHFCVC